MARNRQAAMAAIATAWIMAFVMDGATAAPPTKLIGFDDMSCRAWTASKSDADQRQLYLTWIRGVLSGHNYARPGQQVSAVSTGTVENFVDRYCKDNPQGDFASAALRMSDAFSGRNEPISK